MPVTSQEAPLFEHEEFGEEVREKILRICRDNIIASNRTIRQIFKIDSNASDVLVNPYFIKKRMKDLCGIDASFKEICWFVDSTMTQMMKKLQLKAVMGQEMGFPGYVRARY